MIEALHVTNLDAVGNRCILGLTVGDCCVLVGGFQVSSCRHVGWGPLQVLQGFFPRQSLFTLPHLRQPQHRRLACTKLLLSGKGKRRNLSQASISWVALRFALFSSLPFMFPSLTSLLPVAKLLTPLSLFFENLPLGLHLSPVPFKSSSLVHCKEVIGLHVILVSVFRNRQNSLNGGYLTSLALTSGTPKASLLSLSSRSPPMRLSTMRLYLETRWLGSFLCIFWFSSGSWSTSRYLMECIAV